MPHKPPILIPTEQGPKPFGSREAAEALAAIWGMDPDKVFDIMQSELGPDIEEDVPYKTPFGPPKPLCEHC